jgi:hypothetical protein
MACWMLGLVLGLRELLAAGVGALGAGGAGDMGALAETPGVWGRTAHRAPGRAWGQWGLAWAWGLRPTGQPSKNKNNPGHGK